MDALARDGSQSRRASMKRPWEEEITLPGPGNAWHPAVLPPIDAVPYRSSSHQRVGDIEVHGKGWYDSTQRESVLKKPKYEGHDYNSTSSRNLETNGNISPPPRNPSRSTNHPHLCSGLIMECL